MSFSTESRLTLPVGDRDHRAGNPEAAITLVEYGDYECPYCAAAHKVVLEIQRQLEGKLLFVYRNFPLTNAHTHAQEAAESAESAGAQGLFWEMHDALFERPAGLSSDVIRELAAQIGLDIPQLEADLRAGTYGPRVKEDFMSGIRSGVNGTPTFFMNDVRYDGFADFDSLMLAIESVMR